MNMKAAAEVMRRQVKEHQRLPANHQKLGERHRTNSPSHPQKEPIPWSWTYRHLGLGLLASRTVRQHISVVVRPSIHGTLLWRPQEMNTVLSKCFLNE